MAATQRGQQELAVVFVVPSTIKTQFASLLTKLRADNRAQQATIATQRDLLAD